MTTLQPQKIVLNDDASLNVPDNPIVPFIEGDGIGRDIWPATQLVLDKAVEKAYAGQRKIEWLELLVGEKGYDQTGDWLSEAALATIREHVVAIKGPMTTPVGTGIRSLNVAIRQKLDLYACVRPVRYIDPVPSPMKDPTTIDMVVFRENTEDIYLGVEWAANSEEADKVINFLNTQMGTTLSGNTGIGIKPISVEKTKRLVAKAITYAIEHDRASVTLMHKGNIMKYTEGAFSQWGYEVAKERFGDKTITEAELWDQHNGQRPEGKVVTMTPSLFVLTALFYAVRAH